MLHMRSGWSQQTPGPRPRPDRPSQGGDISSEPARAAEVIPLAKRITDCFKSNCKAPLKRRRVGSLGFSGNLVSNNSSGRLREPVSVFEWSAWNVQII